MWTFDMATKIMRMVKLLNPENLFGVDIIKG
jgi:hypothetical protein